MLKKDSPVESGQGDVELLSTPEASSLTPKVQQRKRLHDVLDEKLLSKRPKPSSASVVVQPITSVAAMETTSETVSTVTDTPPKRALDGPLEAPVSKASDTTQSSEVMYFLTLLTRGASGYSSIICVQTGLFLTWHSKHFNTGNNYALRSIKKTFTAVVAV